MKLSVIAVRFSVAIAAMFGLASCITTALPNQPGVEVMGLPQAQLPAISAPASAQVIASPADAMAAWVPLGTWYCEWFANRNLFSPAVYTATLPAVLFDGSSVPPPVATTADGFSMRCVSRQVLDAPQNHRFTLKANGGLRFFVDEQPSLSEWRTGLKDHALDIAIVAHKEYRLRLEFYSSEGNAKVSLTHEANFYNAWRGTYFNEPSRSSVAVRQSNDGLHNDNLVLDWREGAPAGVNPDYFSAIWEQRIQTIGGTYRFWGDADDELKIYVDGKLFYDNGGKGSPYDKQIKLARGFHLVEVHYAEYTGNARMVLQWERLTQ